MIVVFIRHGIAEKAKNPDTDAMRELTPEGRRKAVQIARGLAQLLPEGGNLLLWSSPLVRARQTAEILADRLAALPLQVQPFLAEPDWSIPASALRLLPPETVVLMVGHEPFLGDWCKALSGSRLLFRRGAAAAVSLPNGPDGRGELMWFAQPAMLQMMGRDNPRV